MACLHCRFARQPSLDKDGKRLARPNYRAFGYVSSIRWPGQFFLNRHGQRRCSAAHATPPLDGIVYQSICACAVDKSPHDFNLHKRRWKTNLIFGLVSSSEQSLPGDLSGFRVFHFGSISSPPSRWLVCSAANIPILISQRPRNLEWTTLVTANIRLTMFFIVL
jgi:hypothetical protein